MRSVRAEPGEVDAAPRAWAAVREAAVAVREGPIREPQLVAWVPCEAAR